MIKCEVITPSLSSAVADWHQKAVNCREISRFLSGSSYLSFDLPPDSTWTKTFIMDTYQEGLAILSTDRAFPGTVSICLHVLPSTRQKLTAGSLIAFSHDYARFNLACKYLEWTVHGTNDKCLSLSLIRATQWGQRDDVMWDSELGESVAAHSFRYKLKDKRLYRGKRSNQVS